MKEVETREGFELERNSSDYSVLQIRLNADYVVNNFKTFLTGKIQIVDVDEEGNAVMKEKQIAQPKANNEGIQFLLSYAQTIINSQVVQGNFTDQQYENYIAEIHDGLIVNLMNNLNRWEVDEDNYETIIDEFLNLVQPFISRLIKNKERESYSASIRTVESNNVAQQRTGMFK